MEDGKLTEREICRLYLGGLPEKIRAKVLDAIPVNKLHSLLPLRELKEKAQQYAKRERLLEEYQPKTSSLSKFSSKQKKEEEKKVDTAKKDVEKMDNQMERLEQMFSEMKIYMTGSVPQAGPRGLPVLFYLLAKCEAWASGRCEIEASNAARTRPP